MTYVLNVKHICLNNFLTEKTKKLEAELFQVRAQLERTLSAKLDEMLSLQKSASDRTGLAYDFSSPNISISSTTIFVPPANNTETENNDVKNCQVLKFRTLCIQNSNLYYWQTMIKTMCLEVF